MTGDSPFTRREIGTVGEDAAARILMRRGYTIIARNVRTRRGEIDLIARDGGTLVFVEVRSRRGAPPGTAAESIGSAKRHRLSQLADEYVQTLSNAPESWRIDALALELDSVGNIRDFELIRNAVEG